MTEYELSEIYRHDRMIEDLWQKLCDIPMNPQTERIEEDFLNLFSAGTDRETIWHWFDDHYSKGVASLLYGDNI